MTGKWSGRLETCHDQRHRGELQRRGSEGGVPRSAVWSRDAASV